MSLENRSIEAFVAGYRLKMAQFRQALDRVEARSKGKETGRPRLSTRMRESWRTERS